MSMGHVHLTLIDFYMACQGTTRQVQKRLGCENISGALAELRRRAIYEVPQFVVDTAPKKLTN